MIERIEVALSSTGARGRLAARLLAALLSIGPSMAMADTYTCVSSKGKPYISDRPIQECADVSQTVRNADGSLKRTIEPSMTAEEGEAAEACKREHDAEVSRQREVKLHDRTLLARYPDEAAHAKARALALDDTKRSIIQSEKRMVALAAERKPLSDEAEFYVHTPMPMTLKQSIDANDAATSAQRSLIANQQAETGRINARYDEELARLRRLWAGAPAGSLDPAPALTCSTRKASR